MISVIVPSYKPQSYIWDCLDSIRNQTLEHNQYETVVVLNGCNEPFKTQIEDYIRQHKSEWTIRLIQTDTPGVSNARNLGIKNSIGEFVTFVDDDDIVSPCFLEKLLVVSSSSCVGCSNSVVFDSTLEKTSNNFISLAYRECKGKEYSIIKFRKFLSPPVGKLLHKDIIGDDEFPDNLEKSEDSVFCLKLTPRIQEMRLTDEDAIYYQRKRAGSATRSKNSFGYEFRALCKLEVAYLKIWMRHPFRYNVLLVLSRMAGGFKNFLSYVR